MFRTDRTRPARRRLALRPRLDALEGRTLLSASGEWAFRTGGPSSDVARSATVDSAGDLYVTGYFTGTVDFDPADASGTDSAAILTSGGGGTDQDIFVAKYSPTGAFLWARHMGGSSGGDSGEGVAVSQDPTTGALSVVVTGYFYGAADFSGTGAGGAAVRTSAGGADAFVEKMDASGNMLWVTTLGGTNDDLAKKVAVDGQGNVYLTGYFSGTARFGPTLTLTSTASGLSSPTSDAFVAKLDGNGNVAWAKGGGGSTRDYGYGLAIGRSATGATAVIVTGQIDYSGLVTGPAVFGGVSLPNKYAGFVWDLDAASGSTSWASEMTPSGNGPYGTSMGSCWSAATDSAGNIVVAGWFAGTVNFGGTTLTDYGDGLSAGPNSDFVEKLSPSGALIWVKALGEPAGGSYGGRVSVDDQGDVYATGYFTGLTDFNPASPGTATFDTPLASQNSYINHGYVWEMDPNGGFVSAWDTGANVYPNAAVPYRDPVTGAPAVDVFGQFSGTATFPTGDTLTSAGGYDTFALKLNRQLGTLAGTVFNDLNDNGANDEAAPLQGWTVSLSQVQNGVSVPTGLSATTDAQGRYTFYNLAPGTYSVAASPPTGTSGFAQTAPAAGQPRVTTLGAGQFTGGLDFGEFTPNQVKTYSSTSSVKIPINGGSTSLSIPDSYTIYDLNVVVNISQVNDSGIHTLTLTAPDGTTVTLINTLTTTGANFTNTTFDDAAAAPIGAGTAPFTGSFRPISALSAFDGKNVQGTWKLNIGGSSTGTFTVKSWSLVVTGPKSGTATATATAMAMPAPSAASVAIAPATAGIPSSPTTAAGATGLSAPPIAVSQPPAYPPVIVKAVTVVPVPSRVRPASALTGNSGWPSTLTS